ncbi:MAG: hypothetical protein J7501_17715, partial [Bdellovibrio sp.]|nr:hypothetical protein [Bdellovibrio sp.]
MSTKLKWGWVIGIPVLLVAFQNCGDYVLDKDVMENASLANAQAVLDSQTYSTYTSASKSSLVRWYQQSATNLVDQPYAGAEKLSFVVALDKAMTGRVFALNSSADNLEETSITVTGGKIRLSRIASAGNLYYSEVALPSAGTKMVIAVRTGIQPDDYEFLVNGVSQTIKKVKTGAPQDFSFATKSIVMGSTGGRVYEYMLYTDRLNLGQLNSLSRLVGQNNSIKEVIFDPSVLTDSGEGNSSGPDEKLVAVRAILDSRCVSCHKEFTNATAGTMLTSGYVVAGSPLQSQLYTSLKGASGSGNKSMP